MSTIIDGELIQSEMTKKAKGGTEAMRDRLLKYVDPALLQGKAIHFSRVTQYSYDHKNILYCHDLAEDSANDHLHVESDKFDMFVFVSAWQRDMFVRRFNLPYSKCKVVQNAVEVGYDTVKKPVEGPIRFIYHTTPHRGLELLLPVFATLSNHYDIHLDVFSSFSIYGWDSRDEPYKELFKAIEDHPKMTYHGAKDNKTVLEYLEKAHVFLYPCTWVETSCIAMIEAIKSGVTVIHPDLGALPETASSKTFMYPYTEDVNEHAQMAANWAASVIDQRLYHTGEIAVGQNVLPYNTIHNFKNGWERVLSTL